MSTATAASTDPQAIVQSSIRKISSIATLPEITVKIIKTVENPRSSASQLHAIVSHDPALVTRILKVVNSAFYGLPGQIASIERAIVLLGLNAVKNIAVAASLGQLFRGVKLCEAFSAKDLWTHCIAVAVTSREIARMQKLPIADEAFLAGLIHDIGILVELQTAPEKLKAVCAEVQKGTTDFCSAERTANSGVDHQMLGMGLAELWKFPRPCQLVAGYHHRPSELTDSNRTLVRVVHVADILCCSAGSGFNLTALNVTPDPDSLEELKLNPASLETIKNTVPTWLQTASGLFG